MRTSDRLLALRALMREPLRTALTLLGIIIGSGAIVLVAGLVAGAETALIAANQSITGSDLIEVRSKNLPERERLRGRPELDRHDGDALRQSWLTRGHDSYAENHQSTRARAGSRQKDVRFVSADETSLGLFQLDVGLGRRFNPDDIELARRVCIVGDKIWRELLEGKPLTASTTLRADDVLYRVIGVLAPKPMIGSTTGTNTWGRKILVPGSTFDSVYAPEHGVRRIVLRKADAAEVSPALDFLRPALKGFLKRRHGGAENFEFDDAEARALEATILRIVKLLLIASGVLTLMTGAINVANVMFVNVAERTREIGLRRAMGEPQDSLVTQFLLEAGALGLLGGLLGVASGVLLVFAAGFGLGQVFSAFAVRIEVWSLVAGVGLSVLAGLVAGLLPAMRAARLDPVQALRSE